MTETEGFEPTTDRLTADSSTTELLRNNITCSLINTNTIISIILKFARDNL